MPVDAAAPSVDVGSAVEELDQSDSLTPDSPASSGENASRHLYGGCAAFSTVTPALGRPRPFAIVDDVLAVTKP